MARIGHGDRYSPTSSAGVSALAAPDPASRFDFMFDTLRKKPANLLPTGAATVQGLKALGAAMEDFSVEGPDGEGKIPSAYTYFGQFLDHDVTMQQPLGASPDIGDPNLAPIANPAAAFINARVPWLDLDSLYAGIAAVDPAAPDKMLLGKVVSGVPQRPAGKSDFNDLPRRAPSNDIATDREALIGDPRNDENLVIAQLHLAFLRAHNKLVDTTGSRAAAQTELRRRYQSLALLDFAKRVADPTIVSDIIANGPKFFKPKTADKFFMPFEYSAAAYRFGHSMVRKTYAFNLNFRAADFLLLFTFTALSGQMGGGVAPEFETLPENWIIEWERFVELGAVTPQPARLIDTKLAEPLSHLRKLDGSPEGPPHDRLAVRNLLRGYLLGLPTGQAVATAMGLEALSGAKLVNAVGPAQGGVLVEHGFDQRTPLWYYILAEAQDPDGPKGAHLGPVGSRILAETLWNMIKFSPDSIIDSKGQVQGPTVTLAEIIALSGNGA